MVGLSGMRFRVLRQRVPAMTGMAALALLLLTTVVVPQTARGLLRDVAFDVVLDTDRRLWAPSHADAQVVVVDIDRPSIEAFGPWQWPRDRIARLVELVAARQPAAIAIDVLFAEPDDRSPAALARRLGALAQRADITALAENLPDDDKRLAEAIRKAPVTLGFVLDPDRDGALAGAPIVTRGALPLGDLWRAAGAIGPTPSLAAAARGVGALPLPGGADGMIRHVPLFVVAGDTLLPGLAADALRLMRGASSFLIEVAPPEVAIGDRRIALPRDGLLRLVPVAPERHAARTLSAADVLEGRADVGRLSGALVIIGGSSPELGGLRGTPSDPLAPSVQIQADAVEQMLSGRVPRPLAEPSIVEPLTILLVGSLAVVAGTMLSPLVGAGILIGALAALWGAAVAISALADRLVDPLTPSLVSALVFSVAAGTTYSRTRRREALLHRRLEQHLAPAVVRRIVEQPGLVKLNGERREVTALFTDLEGFTALTHRVGPQELVAMLDQYFEGVAGIVIEHGGMIDKIVGDAVHALFNAPLDLADHPRRAVDCAIAIQAWSEGFRRRAAAMELGRTRIGIETGPAVVGDVGIRSKLDYTAHGDAVNMAARLEAANKELGSAICVGPTAAGRCDVALLRPLASLTVRGRAEPITVYEPWPGDASPGWREAYLAAYRMLDGDPRRAAALFEKVAVDRPLDPVPHLIAERLRSLPVTGLSPP
jgi:adenylate cyclase